MSYVIKEDLIGAVTIRYFGNEKDKSGKTIKTTTDFETEMRKEFDSDEAFHKAIEEEIKKTVKFNFKGVSVSELIELNLSQTTVFKLWYNNFLTKKTLMEIRNLPKEIEVSVRDLLDGRKTGRLSKKSEAELQKDAERLRAKLAKIQAMLDMKSNS